MASFVYLAGAGYIAIIFAILAAGYFKAGLMLMLYNILLAGARSVL